MDELLAVLRNDFEKVDRAEIARLADGAIHWIDAHSGGKIAADALPAYWQLQDWYLGPQYRPYYTEKGSEDHDDSSWRQQRSDVASRMIGTLGRIEKAIDPNWKKDMALAGKPNHPRGCLLVSVPKRSKTRMYVPTMRGGLRKTQKKMNGGKSSVTYAIYRPDC